MMFNVYWKLTLKMVFYVGLKPTLNWHWNVVHIWCRWKTNIKDSWHWTSLITRSSRSILKRHCTLIMSVFHDIKTQICTSHAFCVFMFIHLFFYFSNRIQCHNVFTRFRIGIRSFYEQLNKWTGLITYARLFSFSNYHFNFHIYSTIFPIYIAFVFLRNVILSILKLTSIPLGSISGVPPILLANNLHRGPQTIHTFHDYTLEVCMSWSCSSIIRVKLQLREI